MTRGREVLRGLAVAVAVLMPAACAGEPQREPSGTSAETTVSISDATVPLPNWPYRSLVGASSELDRAAVEALTLPGGSLLGLERWAPVVSGEVPGGYIALVVAADSRQADALFLLARPDAAPRSEPSEGWIQAAQESLVSAEQRNTFWFTLTWPLEGKLKTVVVAVAAPAVSRFALRRPAEGPDQVPRVVAASNGVAVEVFEADVGITGVNPGIGDEYLPAVVDPLARVGYRRGPSPSASTARAPTADAGQ